MHDPLGLSIGTTGFVAVRAGQPPVRRRAQLSLCAHQPAQLGTAAERGGAETGVLIDGFVERIGEPEPLIAADGSAHRPEALLADAIGAMLDTVSGNTSQLALAVPAHWPPATRQLLAQALHTNAVTRDVTPQLVPDCVAALTALHAERGVATRGVVALLDFGGGGTTISLADAESGFQPIGEIRRYRRLSGNGIDQAILAYILGGNGQDGDAAGFDTAMIGDIARLTEECRRAKEQLSVQTATELVVELPGFRTTIALTRAELEQLIREPLGGVLNELEDLLRCSGIGHADLVALATVGGGAHIPLVGERLAAQHRNRVPVVGSQRPMLAIAVGAALCAAERPGTAKHATAPAMAMSATSAVTTVGAPLRGVEFDEPAPSMPQELAWSQEESHPFDEPVPFTGMPYDDVGTDTRPPSRPVPPHRPATGRRPNRLPQLVLGLAGLMAASGVVGVAYTVMGTAHETAPTQPANSVTVPVAPPSAAPPEPAPVAPPPIVASSTNPPEPAPPPVTTTQPPVPTTTTAQPTPTTTTAPPTTTTTTTTTTTAPTTTSEPPTTSTATTTSAPMRTEYLTIPLVPIPIPIQVPGN